MHNQDASANVIATFYQFTRLGELQEWRRCVCEFGESHGFFGTVLLAPEGINATVAGSAQAIAKLHQWLTVDKQLRLLQWQQTECGNVPFRRFKVRIKREIVRLGVEALDVEQKTGVFLNPREWNALLQDPQLLLIDARNRYEVAIGTFPGALDPDTRSFSEFVEFVETKLAGQQEHKIAMFCTGGIRCEKASSYLISRGYRHVFQLRGGILNYLAQTPAASSRWRGECVVFDERVAVDETQQGGKHHWCSNCGTPIENNEGARCARCVALAETRP